MQSLELQILCLLFATVVASFPTHRPRPKWWPYIPITLLLLVIVHLVVEGFSWQMIPAYALTALLSGSAVRALVLKHRPPATGSSPYRVGLDVVGIVLCAIAIILPIAAQDPSRTGLRIPVDASQRNTKIARPVIRSGEDSLSAEDIAKIKRVHSKYEETWLKGDRDGVRALFIEDCVLLPPHGGTPRIGQKGLNEYWFPADAPPTQVTKLIVTPQSIGGDAQIAYVWGADEVAWTTVNGGKTTTSSHKGVFLNVLKKQPDGNWRISHHMWDEPVALH